MNDSTTSAANMSDPQITDAIEERCRVRLENDLKDLSDFAKRVGHERLQMGVAAFGGRILQIGLKFPRVRTGLRTVDGNAVVVQAIEVIADITPGAFDTPFPLGEPMVRLRFPDLPEGLQPFLSNVHFVGSGVDAGPGQGANPLSAMLGAMFNCPSGFGVPCLWRRWHPQRDLVWLARQIHALLVAEPSTMASPNDCLDPEAARYWVSQTEHTVPLEPLLAPPQAATPKQVSTDTDFVLTRSVDPSEPSETA
jgi:hypothetical protein